jgi:hemolysin type calcium-binding protein
VYAASIDEAGNQSTVTRSTVRIDHTAPHTTIRLDPAAPDWVNGWYRSRVTATVTVDDPTATVRCVLNPATVPAGFDALPARHCAPPAVSNHGRHTLYAASRDQAGNSSRIVRQSFKTVGAVRCQGRLPTHIGTPGADSIVGTPGRDVIVALGGNDTIRGRGGNDLICAGAGDDAVDGGRGDDRLIGGAGDDRLRGGRGNDRLHGGRGNDRLTGGPGADRLFGGSGRDRLIGGRGNDVLDGGRGFDLIRGGPGRNRLKAHASNLHVPR